MALRMTASLSFAGFAWRNIWRRRLRTALTLCGIGMGVGAFVALVGFSRAFEHAWLEMYESSGTDLAVVQRTFLNTTVDENAGATLRALPQVQAVAPMVLNMMAVTSDVNTLVYGWPADSFEFEGIEIRQGRRFQNGAAEVLLGELLAEGLHKKAGDAMEIQGQEFTVAGVFHSASALEAGAVIMPLNQTQKLGSLEGKVTAFHVRLKPPAPGESAEHRLQAAETAIEAALPGLRAIPAAQRAANNQLVSLAHAAAWGTSGIALLVAALGIANTMAMSVFERTREIGILRALGWRRERIVRLILLESGALGLAGGVAGVLLGWLALRLLGLLPQTASIVTTSLSWMTLLEAVAIATLVGILAGAWPAWRGARLSPVEALHHE
jgi:putative ABC transport system permease protein